MRHLLPTTALIAALAVPAAMAQTPATPPGGDAPAMAAPPGVTVPEGFARRDGALTAEELLGATVYDVTGDPVGEVEDLVLASVGDTATDPPATTAPAPADSGTPPAPAPDSQAATTPAAPAAPDAGATGSSEAALTHAILDIGGFLGMGVHRVAIPVADLQVFAGSSEVRVYLPWTREQLEALPEYNADDPATLGDPMYGMGI